MSGRTPGAHAVDTLVNRCKTAVERCAPYSGAIPCSICGVRSVQDGREDDGRRHYDETEHDFLPLFVTNAVPSTGPGADVPSGPFCLVVCYNPHYGEENALVYY